MESEAGGTGIGEALEGGAVVVGSGRQFVDDASSRLREAQAALTDLLDDAGLGGAKPTRIGRELGLDKTLAWKIARFVGEPDAASAARHMPGAAGVEIVLKAATAFGVEASRVDAVRRAEERLREFVLKRAGDRRSFEAMLARGGRDDRIESEERRALYRSASAIWGVRAQVQMLMLALRPSDADPERLDVLQLGGMFGFERLRADVPWIIRRLSTRSDAGENEREFVRDALDPSGATGSGLPLVPRFCSQPLPEIRQFEGSDGVLYDEIAPGAVGRHGAVTVVSGEVYRAAVPRAWSEENREARYKLSVRTPVEAVVFDVLVHESLTHFGDSKTEVHGLLEDRPSIGNAGRSEPLYEPEMARRLGTPARAQSTRMSGYAGMVEDALGVVGWGGLGSFRGYRLEMEYPPAPSAVDHVFSSGA